MWSTPQKRVKDDKCFGSIPKRTMEKWTLSIWMSNHTVVHPLHLWINGGPMFHNRDRDIQTSSSLDQRQIMNGWWWGSLVPFPCAQVQLIPGPIKQLFGSVGRDSPTNRKDETIYESTTRSMNQTQMDQSLIGWPSCSVPDGRKGKKARGEVEHGIGQHRIPRHHPVKPYISLPSGFSVWSTKEILSFFFGLLLMMIMIWRVITRTRHHISFGLSQWNVLPREFKAHQKGSQPFRGSHLIHGSDHGSKSGHVLVWSMNPCGCGWWWCTWWPPQGRHEKMGQV